MTPRKPTDEDRDATGEHDEAARARALILQRRNRFIAAAIAGLGAANSACSDTHQANGDPPASQHDGGAGLGGGGSSGRAPNVCLSLPVAGQAGFGGAGVGGAGTGGAGRGGSGGSEPRICLTLDVCDNGRPPPCVCLEPPIDFDAGTEGQEG